MQIGVTCLLAAVALQFAEGGTLPEVSYLTLADRAYAVFYVGIAAAVVESIRRSNPPAALPRADGARARRVDRALLRLKKSERNEIRCLAWTLLPSVARGSPLRAAKSQPICCARAGAVRA